MATIESYIIPQRLYRYRSLEKEKFEREIKTIRDAYLYCAPYSELNDPMEGFYTPSSTLRHDERYLAVRQAVRKTKAKLRISSFSEAFDNEVMWAHYAEEFKGICIAYSFASLLSNLTDDVELVRMSYSERVPMVRSTDKH